jgi:hypothetical protein
MKKLSILIVLLIAVMLSAQAADYKCKHKRTYYASKSYLPFAGNKDRSISKRTGLVKRNLFEKKHHRKRMKR